MCKGAMFYDIIDIMVMLFLLCDGGVLGSI